MTAEVNAAAAAGCEHARSMAKHKKEHGNETNKNANQKGSSSDQKACGFGAQMMDIARHAANGGTWEVTGSSGTSPRLSTNRQVSSIPKSDYTPSHQSDRSQTPNWEYPSEDMYFKAMQRKGWAPDATQMQTIVAIHNTVNEQSWHEVLKWESMHPTKSPPKLKRFVGKPSDYSPKARLSNMLGWSVLPFDRHDWFVEREDGTEVRYVIDFYSGQPEPGKPLSVYLDVRPALDSIESVFDRVRWQWHEKIQPLLPFRGVFTSDVSTSHQDTPSTQTSTKVVPRKEK